MAWDSWDTGFSMRLSKITCEDRASAQRPCPPRALLPRPRGSPARSQAGEGVGACLLAVPRPSPAGQGVLMAVIHVLVQVPRAQGARWHLLEVEAGLGDTLHQLGGGVRVSAGAMSIHPEGERAAPPCYHSGRTADPKPTCSGPRMPPPRWRKVPALCPRAAGSCTGSRASVPRAWGRTHLLSG